MRRQRVTREAARKRPSTSSSRQGGALPARGCDVVVGARRIMMMGIRVFVLDLVVLVLVVLSIGVVLVIGTGASQTTSSIDPSHPQEFVVAQSPMFLVIGLQAVMVIEQVAGAVRTSFPVIVLRRHVVAQRQFLLAVHQYRARV